jgi:hypothetical protein
MLNFAGVLSLYARRKGSNILCVGVLAVVPEPRCESHLLRLAGMLAAAEKRGEKVFDLCESVCDTA